MNPFARLILLALPLWLGACNAPDRGAAGVPVQAPVAPPSAPVREFSLAVATLLDGRVRSTPAGIDCGTACTTRFTEGSSVRLQAEAGSGHRFLEWRGDCTGSGACELRMAADRQVSAVFEPLQIIDPPPPPPPTTVAVCEPYGGPALATLRHYEGAMHEHSSYSDGDITRIPADYFRAIREQGYHFVGSSEHSDTLDTGVFVSVGNDCFTTPDGLLTCLTPGPDELQKWLSTGSQAAAASDGLAFLGIRGFEWTSDRFGHINVYFSHNFSNAKTDGGYAASMENFWSWFARDPAMPGLGGSLTAPVPFGGGGDGLAHFNHPNDKCLSDSDSGCDWNGFALVPEAVERMFGMELYNDGNGGDRYQPFYRKALDAGWRLAPVGSEDEHGLEYGSERRPKTVTVAGALTEAGFREAWLARRSYALSPGWHLRAEQLADGAHPMGSTLQCPAGETVPLAVRLTQADGRPFTGEYRLFASGSEEPLAVQRGESARFELPVPTEAGTTRWYFVRVHGGEDGQSVAYLAPVWVTAK